MKIEGSLNGSKLKIAIVAARFNDFIVSRLVGGAHDCLKRHEVDPANIDEIWVPGAFEIPVCTELILRSSQPDAVIALGVIIRGATEHADLVAASVTDALQRAATKYCVPVVHEVLLLDDKEQAEERCLGATINRGTEAARVALTMVNLFAAMRAKFSGDSAPRA